MSFPNHFSTADALSRGHHTPRSLATAPSYVDEPHSPRGRSQTYLNRVAAGLCVAGCGRRPLENLATGKTFTVCAPCRSARGVREREKRTRPEK